MITTTAFFQKKDLVLLDFSICTLLKKDQLWDCLAFSKKSYLTWTEDICRIKISIDEFLLQEPSRIEFMTLILKILVMFYKRLKENIGSADNNFEEMWGNGIISKPVVHHWQGRVRNVSFDKGDDKVRVAWERRSGFRWKGYLWRRRRFKSQWNNFNHLFFLDWSFWLFWQSQLLLELALPWFLDFLKLLFPLLLFFFSSFFCQSLDLLALLLENLAFFPPHSQDQPRGCWWEAQLFGCPDLHPIFFFNESNQLKSVLCRVKCTS